MSRRRPWPAQATDIRRTTLDSRQKQANAKNVRETYKHNALQPLTSQTGHETSQERATNTAVTQVLPPAMAGRQLPQVVPNGNPLRRETNTAARDATTAEYNTRAPRPGLCAEKESSGAKQVGGWPYSNNEWCTCL